MRAVSATFAFAVSAIDLEPDYSQVCEFEECTAAPPPSNLPVQFMGGDDAREILTFQRSAKHVCQYPGPETMGCEGIPTSADTSVTTLLCGSCQSEVLKDPDGSVGDFWVAYFCSEDGTKAWRQRYSDSYKGCVEPIGDCDECAYKDMKAWLPQVIDLSPREDLPRCDKTGICSADEPPTYCQKYYYRGCQHCDMDMCTGCCRIEGGSESITATLVWHAVRDAKFHCDAGSCIHAPFGGVSSLHDCRSACAKPAPPETFQCTNAQCVPAQTGIGKENCEALCGATSV